MKLVREVIEKLKEEDIKAQCPHPAQLKVFLETGTKVFTTLTQAAPMLKDLGITVEEDEEEKLQRVRMRGSWSTVTGQNGKKRQPGIPEEDLQPPLSEL